MPQIGPISRELVVKDGQILLKEGKVLRARRRKCSIKHLSDREIYERKQRLREERAREIERNEQLSAYILWICGIQSRLGLSNNLFAKRIGVSAQTVKLWKRKSGHFPSKWAYLRLLELDIESRIPVITLKIKYGVRM